MSIEKQAIAKAAHILGMTYEDLQLALHFAKDKDQPDDYLWKWRNDDDAIAHLSMLWQEYALCEDSKLSADGKELKQKLLKAIPMRELSGCDKHAQTMPHFTLIAQDKTAPECVKTWVMANMATLGPTHPKIVSAMKTIEAMETWPTRKMPD